MKENKELILANTIEAKNHGIEIDTLCITKQHHVVQVKSFNAGYKGPGYCLAIQPWNIAYYLNKEWGTVLCYIKDGVISRNGEISNYHKISALTPINSLNLSSAAAFIEKYGEDAFTELQFFTTFKRSFKATKEEKKNTKEEMKKIREAAKILYDFYSKGNSIACEMCRSN